MYFIHFLFLKTLFLMFYLTKPMMRPRLLALLKFCDQIILIYINICEFLLPKSSLKVSVTRSTKFSFLFSYIPCTKIKFQQHYLSGLLLTLFNCSFFIHTLCLFSSSLFFLFFLSNLSNLLS